MAIVKIKRLWSTAVAALLAALWCSRAFAAKRSTAWDFTLQTQNHAPMPLEQFAGHPILLVTTASECGFTEQYRQLQEIWERYRSSGLIVLGVPSDDFGHQEPGSDADIQKFCQSRFRVTFPMAAKTHVRGKTAHPLFVWAAEKTWFRPRWNFHKYLIDRRGNLVGSYFSWTRVTSPKIKRAIERELARSPSKTAKNAGALSEPNPN